MNNPQRLRETRWHLTGGSGVTDVNEMELPSRELMQQPRVHRAEEDVVFGESTF